MIKLFDRPPEGVTVDGRFYKCDFDFRNVLKMLDVMQRDDIYPDARDYVCLRCVYSHRIPSKIASRLYKEVCDILFEKAPETSGERLTSFEQDAALIRAAFRQVYSIDLFRDKLTWFEFTELLHGLPEGSKYEEVIGIRARPLPAPNKYNVKEREWLIKAKQQVRIHLTEREQAKKYENDVGKIFAGVMSMIQKGSDESGE